MSQDLRSLPVGQKIADYEIEGVLGQGAFGITYLAKDVMLHRKFAIKEYYPREFAVRDSTLTVKAAGNKEDRDTYTWGLERFLDEARILARFDDPNIIAARRFFEANGTAYLVMDYCDGKSLDAVIKENGSLSNENLNRLIPPLLAGLSRVHSANFLHRDIKPSNIFIRQDGSPVLLDFGAARQEVVSHSKSVTSLATPGYGAVEQYSTHGKQGPWTDIYGMGATLYRVVTGEKPQDSPGRMLNDELIPASVKAKGKYSDRTLKAIDAAMQVYPEKRPQSIEQWKSMFDFGDSQLSRIRQPTISNSNETKKPIGDVIQREEPKLISEQNLNQVDSHHVASIQKNIQPQSNTSNSKSRVGYLLVGGVVAAILGFALWPQSSSKQEAVKPTAVASDSSRTFSQVNDNQKVSDHKNPGQEFMLFGRALQVPRTGVVTPMNEQETRWCIYEGIRIGVIQTTSGQQPTVNPADSAKFKLECSKRQPDDSAKSKISKELTDSEIQQLKKLKSI